MATENLDPEHQSESDYSSDERDTKMKTDSLQWIPLSKRPEWADVTPVEQNDGKDDALVAKINYSAQFKSVYDYFRAVFFNKELSERSLSLTEEAIELNPANYTVWQFRRDILFHLQSDLHFELRLTRRIIEDNAKNYQVWQHRRVIVEHLAADADVVDDVASAELRFAELALASDAKNYHVWQHRQWIVSHFNIFRYEYELIERLLLDDVRNNSAWNHRHFVFVHDPQFRDTETGCLSETGILSELEFVLAKLAIVKGNESGWNFIRGLVDLSASDVTKDQINESVLDFCNQALASFGDSLHPFSVTRHILAAKLDCIHYEMDSVTSKCDERKQLKSEFDGICDQLASTVDPIRETYWTYLKNSTI